MNKMEAFRLIANVCANHKGTLREHTQIQAALDIVRENIKGDPKEKEDEDVG